MKRLATKTHILAFVLSVLPWVSSTGLAQQEMNLRKQGITPYSVELKPLPTSMSFLGGNGTGSVGLGGEVFLSPNTAIVVGGSYADMNLPNNMTRKATDSNKNEPVPDKLIAYHISPGLRWYSSRAYESSWYGGAALGYSDIHGKYAFEDTTIDSKVSSVLPTLEAGYRWLFTNNFLVRLGAAVAGNMVTKHDETAVDKTSSYATDGEDKVKKINQTPVLAALDLGLGYAF